MSHPPDTSMVCCVVAHQTLLRAVRVGGSLSTTVDGTATVGLSNTVLESSGTTSLSVADVNMQSTGRLDGSAAGDVSFGMQGAQVPARSKLASFA